MNRENENGKNGWISGLPKSIQWSILLMFKVSAFIMHKEYHRPDENKIPQGWEWFYSDAGWVSISTDILVYILYTGLFLFVVFRVFQSIYRQD